jgi:hypothetical protein
MVTVEDIENELNPDKQVGFINKRVASAKKKMMDATINELKKKEALVGKDIVKALIDGERKLTAEEFAIAAKKFGTTGINQIEAMESLNPAQKQYLYKRMGY